MKLVTLRSAGRTEAARVENGRAVPLGHEDVGALLRHAGALGVSLAEAASAEAGESVAAGGAELAPVVTLPGKIICVGLNYRTHILEMKRAVPEFPTLFAKYPAALIGAGDDIRLPAASEQMDWEVELGVVIGRRARHLDEHDAGQAIAGYTVLNDVTARDFQYRTLQWLQGKTFESTCPFGPALVTPDEVGHARDLEVTCEVDGEVVQRARTSDLVFPPAALVSYLSGILTLEPGDVIATGTPGGVGFGFDPPRYLKDGSVLRSAIEGLGECVNVCVTEEI